jgi:hypothetical protein
VGGLLLSRVVEFGVPVEAALRSQVEHVPEGPEQIDAALVDARGEFGIRAGVLDSVEAWPVFIDSMEECAGDGLDDC